MIKKILLLPFKIIWFIIGWPCILGWKIGTGWKTNYTPFHGSGSGDGGMANLILFLVSIIGVPLAIWLGVPMTIRHYLGYHGPANLVCRFVFKENFNLGQVEESATLATDTNKVEKLEQPITK